MLFKESCLLQSFINRLWFSLWEIKISFCEAENVFFFSVT